MKSDVRRVEKPWGFELIWADTDEYAGKILHIHAGEALSVQYHERKDETLYVLDGSVRFWVGPLNGELEETELGPGEAIRFEPGTVHRMVALSDCRLLEVSTAHLDDVVRLKDRYGRAKDEG